MISLFVFASGGLIVSYLIKPRITFSTNLKTFAHASTPFILTAWLPAFNVIFGLWFLYLNSKGLSEVNSIPLRKAAYIVIGAGIITGIVIFVGTYIISHYIFGIGFDMIKMFTRV